MSLLVKIFIKDYQNTTSPKVREKYGLLSSTVGLLINLLLFTTKFLVGSMTNIISITADGFNNLSDGLSNIISLVSFKMSNKPADKDHPFGHERIEYIASSIVSFLVLLIGIELLTSSIEKIINPSPTTFSIYLIIVLTLSIILKFFLFVFNGKLAKVINSELLRAVSKDSLGDILSTSVVLISILISYFTDLELDAYMGIVVSILILKTGIGLILDSFNELIGKAPDKEFLDEIKTYVTSHKEILGVHDIILHMYGPNKAFMSMHCEVDASINSLVSHDVIDNIEREVHEKYGVSLVIHMDPVDTKNQKINDYRDEISTILKGIDTSLSLHDFRIVTGPSHDNLVFDIERPIDLKISNDEIKEIITNYLNNKYQTHRVFAVITFDVVY